MQNKPAAKSTQKKPAAKSTQKKPAAKEVQKKPASQEEKEEEGAEEEGEEEKDEEADDAEVDADDIAVHTVSVTHAQTGNVRAYVRACSCNSSSVLVKDHKPSLVAEFSLKNHGPKYLEYAQDLKKTVQTRKSTWAKARELGEQMKAKHAI